MIGESLLAWRLTSNDIDLWHVLRPWSLPSAARAQPDGPTRYWLRGEPCIQYRVPIQ